MENNIQPAPLKKLYLTIDDFPTAASEDMLHFLLEKDIRPIIFCIGHTLEKQKKLAVKALSEGFILGNHSYAHQHFSRLSLKDALEDIFKADRILEEIHATAGVAWEKKYFRFPYGDNGDGRLGRIFTRSFNPWKKLKKKAIQEKLAELGYVTPAIPGILYSYYNQTLLQEKDMHWTLDVMEWCLKKEEGMFGIQKERDVLQRLFSAKPFDCRGSVPEKQYGLPCSDSNEIVLMHDCENTFDTFKNIVNEILSRGYTFSSF
ncbi:polysaccharide deacetylase family protein [Pontibacter diazotrophicus]|uniref:Polysaccharide deacetylase family protein n=1 Tax=Pontibacter diazotrophicus TaxID=1400979 RepID=A0A3D8LBV5_9BACT|nr:polysaccharide deacetylase family protein [Pontibacter diazotrophicus]RDV14919.1 polysaccharide deacetylase family protein [Pontibacter diazotrophicus]